MSSSVKKYDLSALGVLFQIFVAVAILAGAVAGAVYLIRNKTEPPKVEFEREALVVETRPVATEEARAFIRAFGNVKAARAATLQSEVAGRVLEQNPDLVVGGIIPVGELLVRLDERDHALALEQAQAEIATAEAELALELGRQAVARREWEMLGRTVEQTELGRSLALREPQIAQRRTAIRQAKLRVERAQLDVERTRIVAPFNALVLEESVEVGELVGVRASVARIVSTDAFHVEVSVPLRDLEAIANLQRNGEEVEVHVEQELGDGRVASFPGRVFKLLGALVPESRMARVVVVVQDPLRLASSDRSEIPLLLGAYVRVRISGEHHPNAVRLPREALRGENIVWIKDADSKLEIRRVHIVDRLENEVLVAEGLSAGERLVVSAIPTPVAGMALRELDVEAPAADSESGAASPAGDAR
ncbi:MAG: efflux RND transporter periplasmic adaptor subunit [Planctomycetota bacterium]